MNWSENDYIPLQLHLHLHLADAFVQSNLQYICHKKDTMTYHRQ